MAWPVAAAGFSYQEQPLHKSEVCPAAFKKGVAQWEWNQWA